MSRVALMHRHQPTDHHHIVCYDVEVGVLLAVTGDSSATFVIYFVYHVNFKDVADYILSDIFLIMFNQN